MENATAFGTQAADYAASRPGYPEKLFAWIAAKSPGRKRVWDVGTGSGQAAVSLADYFDRVHATDLDGSQIAAAIENPKIDFLASPAHKSGLVGCSVDAITVATALHWFDFKLFWPEVRRVARPGALFCAWTYHRANVDAEVQTHLLDPILNILEPYWSEGNRLSWRGYDPAEIGMPFKIIETPNIACNLNWTAAEIANLICSWSAHIKARKGGHEEHLNSIRAHALEKLGKEKRTLIMPLNMVAGHV